MLSIPRSAIDQDRARGLGDREGQEKKDGKGPSGYSVLIRCRPLVVFAVCAMLFHFANAPLLPLVGQKLAQAYPKWATTMMSSCIIAAQLIMLPVALAVGRTADRIGRKPILLVGFAVLPVRAVLYTLSDSAPWLIGVQLLDGVGAGIFGAITPLRRRRPHAGNRPIQPGPGRGRDSPRPRRVSEWPRGRGHRGPSRLFGRVPDLWRSSLHGACGAFSGHARDRVEPL